MSLRHAVLGLLARQPSTGYDLTRAFDISLRSAWQATHSQVYPELAKLEQAGMVEVVARGSRRSKTYALTEPGRTELRRWLIEQEPDRSQRSESFLRLFLTQLLPASDRRHVFMRDLAYMEAQQHELRNLQEVADPDEPFLAQIDLGLRTNDVIIAWLHEQAGAVDKK